MDDRITGPSLRDVMACYPTGVTIVAASDEAGEPYGLTVNSFTSVSLDPPLVLVCIGRSSTSHDKLVAARSFSVNVLSAGQDDTAVRFATEPSEGRFDGVPWSTGPSGDPLLAEAVAWLDCALERVIEGGDHSILLGRVEAAGMTGRAALLFHRGELLATDV